MAKRGHGLGDGVVSGAEELRAHEARLRALVANVPGIVYRCACDADWTMEFISDYVEELTGYAAGDFREGGERTFASVIHPEDRGSVEQEIGEAVRGRRPFSLEYRVLHRDGSVRWVAERGRATLDHPGRSAVA